MCINIKIGKYISKKQETISAIAIMKLFKGVAMIDQYAINNYRIDLYIPKDKLATVCGEYGHKERDMTRLL